MSAAQRHRGDAARRAPRHERRRARRRTTCAPATATCRCCTASTSSSHEGEAVGIVGHNGMGKTTLLKTLVGLLPATAGRISLDGIDVTREPAHARSRLGSAYVPQGRGILPGLTALDNLRLAWTARLRRHRAGGGRARASTLLPRLTPLLDRARRRAVGRRAADPRARPRADAEPVDAAARRAVGRHPAVDRAGDRRDPRAACEARRGSRIVSSSRTSTSCSTSPTASPSSNAAASSARSTPARVRRRRRWPSARPGLGAHDARRAGRSTAGCRAAIARAPQRARRADRAAHRRAHAPAAAAHSVAAARRITANITAGTARARSTEVTP